MKLETILNPLNLSEMAYPVEFNMETLKSLRSYSKRLQYVQSLLPRISSGSSRVVYKIDDEKVLKVAKNKKGLAQNQAETDWGAQQYDVVAKIFDTDENDLFLEMELARKVSPKLFKQATEVSFEEFQIYLQHVAWRKGDSRSDPLSNASNREVVSPERIEELHENEWLQDFSTFVTSYDYYLPGDFSKLSTYGLVERNSYPWIVIIDFGFTEGVRKEHYS